MRFTWLVTSLVVLLFVSCPAPKNERASFDENNNSVETLLEQNGEQEIEKLNPPSTLEERFSYTYGYLLMMTAMRDVQNISTDYFIRGSLDAALNSDPLIASNLMNTVLYEYQEHLMSEASKRLEELAKKNLEDAESFLAINGQRDTIITTSSGLQYEIVKDSDGETPQEHDIVKVNYKLTYLDGREGDASIRGIPSEFSLDSLISGFKEGLMLMRVGSQFRFYVHPNLGYGQEGSSRIEPNTLLIFDVELVEVKKL
ncbi:MAG: FKBP-type peptidyl-prolyl cis-trans isomerase [Sphaerochaetaceae bacterium]|jgi:FKBP-type peptidyl-prolyl cis-trans isomerase